jgi:hypothetical protein
MPTTKEILSWAMTTTTWIDSGFAHGAQGNPSKDRGVKRGQFFMTFLILG